MTKNDPTLASISEIARMFELSVNTVRKKIDAAKIKPCCKVGNSPMYKLNSVGKALFGT